MKQKNSIPVYDLYKTINTEQKIVFEKLEESYSSYDSSHPHRHNYFEIIFFQKSGGFHEIDFNSYLIKKNTLHFVSPEQVHLLRRKKDVTGFVISFTKDIFISTDQKESILDTLPFFNNPYNLPTTLISTNKKVQEFVELFNKISTEYSSQNEDKLDILKLYLSILLLETKRNYSIDNYQKKTSFVRQEMAFKFKKLVDEHFINLRNVKDYANVLNITSGHLNDTIKKEFGKSASEVIFERVILESKRLLFHSPKSIKEIADELKFKDPSYFSRFFKVHEHCSPEEFRSTIREKYQ